MPLFEQLRDVVEQGGFWVAIPLVFLGGVLLNLTPCVFPMIPVTLSFFSSQAADTKPGRKTVWLAVSYVLGLSCTYAVLGLIAARTGALFGSWLQQPVVLVVMAVVMVALALSMFGLYELRVPQAIIGRLGAASAGLGGAFTMGALLGIVASPCVGPFLAGLLLVVSRLQDPMAGFFLFFTLGLGMGVPYMALGMAAQRARRLPKAGPWLVWVKQALGLVLVGVALFFLNPLLPAGATAALAAALLAGSGIYLGWFEPSSRSQRAFLPVRRVAGVVLMLAAALLAVPRPSAAPGPVWRPYSDAALEAAQREGRPALIDIYADWCLPCIEMDHTTFRNPTVVQALADVTTLRLDVTGGVSEEGERLLGQYRIFGAPTVLFLDRTGRERTDLRLMGFARSDEFLARLRRLF